MQFTGDELNEILNQSGPLWLRNADLRGADLRGRILSYAHLGEADLRDADLRFAVLIEAKLALADLRGADLRYANLTETDLRYAKYNRLTKWPSGFFPENAGADFVDS